LAGAHQQFMSNGRPVPAMPAKCLDQVSGAQILQPEIIARRLAHDGGRLSSEGGLLSHR
jgi:hypothetical protein